MRSVSVSLPPLPDHSDDTVQDDVDNKAVQQEAAKDERVTKGNGTPPPSLRTRKFVFAKVRGFRVRRQLRREIRETVKAAVRKADQELVNVIAAVNGKNGSDAMSAGARFAFVLSSLDKKTSDSPSAVELSRNRMLRRVDRMSIQDLSEFNERLDMLKGTSGDPVISLLNALVKTTLLEDLAESLHGLSAELAQTDRLPVSGLNLTDLRLVSAMGEHAGSINKIAHDMANKKIKLPETPFTAQNLQARKTRGTNAAAELMNRQARLVAVAKEPSSIWYMKPVDVKRLGEDAAMWTEVGQPPRADISALHVAIRLHLEIAHLDIDLGS